MDHDALTAANFVYFHMYRDEVVQALYDRRGRWLRPAVAGLIFLIKAGRAVLTMPLALAGLRPGLRGRVWLVSISKNNVDALAPIRARLGGAAVMMATDYRFFRRATPIPMLAGYACALLRLPTFARLYRAASPADRRVMVVFFDRVLLSLGYDIFCRWYLAIYRPRAIVFANDHVFETRVLVEHAERRGIPCFFLQHSSAVDGVPPVFSSYALLEGEHARAKYQAVGSSPARLRLVGMPKFDPHAGYRNGGERVTRVAVCTTRAMGPGDVEAVVGHIRAQWPEWEVVLRPHPSRESSQTYASVIARYGIALSDSAREDVFAFLKGVDVVIAGNSSVLLEAALLNVVPIYYFGAETTFFYQHDRFDKYDYVKNGVALCARDVPALGRVLQEIAAEKPNVRDRARLYCDTLGTEYEGRSAELAAQVIHEVLGTDSGRAPVTGSR